MSSTEPRVAAIVLTFDGRDVTLGALESITRMSYPAYQVVVVDNGSSDGTNEAIREHFPDLEVLRSENNLGPAGGCNLGLLWALERNFDYVLVLNNDIEVDLAMLAQLVEVSESDPTIGCAGPKEYYYWDRDRIWSAGGKLRFREAITNERGDGEIDRGQFERCEEVDYINGCAMLIRAEALRSTGPWDPLYHLAVEDADFCTRMKRHGYSCFYVPSAVLWHMVSYKTGVYSPGKAFHTARSTAIYLRRYATSRQRLIALLFIAASLPLAFLRELPKRNQAAVIAKARGFIDGFRTFLSAPPEWPPSIAGHD